MYKCPACNSVFFFESNLKKHAAAKHRLNNYEEVRANLASSVGINQGYEEHFDNIVRVRRVPREAANMWISASQILDATDTMY